MRRAAIGSVALGLQAPIVLIGADPAGRVRGWSRGGVTPLAPGIAGPGPSGVLN